MATLTTAAFLAIAAQCAPDVAPQTLLSIARVESRLDTHAVHQNADGSEDIGLMQINSKNFGWLGLTLGGPDPNRDAFNPCTSLRAAAEVLTAYSRYNTGDPHKGFQNGYVQKIVAAKAVVDSSDQQSAPPKDVAMEPQQTKPPDDDDEDVVAAARRERKQKEEGTSDGR